MRAMSDERDDLGAMFARVTRRLIAAERPLLERHGLSMWAYIALSHVARSPAGTQLELAGPAGSDKPRRMGLLGGPGRGGLGDRRPAPPARRARTVAITAAGRARHRAA